MLPLQRSRLVPKLSIGMGWKLGMGEKRLLKGSPGFWVKPQPSWKPLISAVRVVKIKRVNSSDGPKGLLDGGATNALRRVPLKNWPVLICGDLLTLVCHQMECTWLWNQTPLERNHSVLVAKRLSCCVGKTCTWFDSWCWVHGIGQTNPFRNLCSCFWKCL